MENETVFNKEEREFSKALDALYADKENKAFKGYTETITDIFVNEQSSRQDIIWKYDVKTGIFKSNKSNSTSISFSGISHKPKNITEAFRYKGREVNNLRAFGIWKKIKKNDYKSLKDAFEEYAKENMEFYNELHRKVEMYKKSGWENSNLLRIPPKGTFRGRVYQADDLLIIAWEEIKKSLEARKKEQSVYYLQRPKDLFEETIKHRGTITFITMKKNTVDLPDFKPAQTRKIRKKYDIFSTCFRDLPPQDQKSKSRQMIEETDKSKSPHVRAYTMSVLLDEVFPQGQGIAVMGKNFIYDLGRWCHQKTVDYDENNVDLETARMAYIDPEIKALLDNPEKLSFDEEIKYRNIRKFIKEVFPKQPDREFVKILRDSDFDKFNEIENNLYIDYKNERKKYYKENIKEKLHYLNEKLFKKNMARINDYIKEKNHELTQGDR